MVSKFYSLAAIMTGLLGAFSTGKLPSSQHGREDEGDGSSIIEKAVSGDDLHLQYCKKQVPMGPSRTEQK